MLLLTPFQFLISSFIIKDRDVSLVLGLLALILLSDVSYYMATGDRSHYYEQHIIIDMLFLSTSLLLKNVWKKIILVCICSVSALTMIYEMSSTYQTALYPYLTYIQIGLLQAIYINLVYKVDWRLPCLRRQRT